MIIIIFTKLRNSHDSSHVFFSLNQCLTTQAERASATPRRKSVWGDQKDDLCTLMNLSSVLCNIKASDCAEMFVKEQGDMLVDAVLLILHSLKDHFSRLVSPSTVRLLKLNHYCYLYYLYCYLNYQVPL